tara:strand:- start:1271 stop:1612 length:342 start_codon:yes stop_codon:yes gene_type:complete
LAQVRAWLHLRWAFKMFPGPALYDAIPRNALSNPGLRSSQNKIIRIKKNAPTRIDALALYGSVAPFTLGAFSAQVPGIICAMPAAPTWLVAFGFKRLSVYKSALYQSQSNFSR